MPAVAKFLLFLWLFLPLLFFATLHPRRAVLITFLGGWLFLPVMALPLSGIPDVSKPNVPAVAALLGVLLFDLSNLSRFRPRWIDFPMLVFILCPLASSLSNHLGLWDGISHIADRVILWGIPYLLGRLYFSDFLAMRELACAIAIAGFIYVPFCLFEMRFSPQLHRWIYGYHQHEFAQTMRLGGFRPMVFMSHGLVVSMWMVMATLTCFWLYWSGLFKKLGKIPVAWVLAALFLTCVLMRSMNAYILFAAGGMTLYLIHTFRFWPAIFLLMVSVPSYIWLRTGTDISMKPIVQLVADTISFERAYSLNVRFHNEKLVVKKALQRPWFGWGGWGRSRIYDDRGRDITITDGLWIIVLGENGLVGLISMLALFITPFAKLWWCYPPQRWRQRFLAAPLLLSLLLLLLMINNVLNSTAPAIFILAMGAVSELKSSESAFLPWTRRRRRLQKVRMV